MKSTESAFFPRCKRISAVSEVRSRFDQSENQIVNQTKHFAENRKRQDSYLERQEHDERNVFFSWTRIMHSLALPFLDLLASMKMTFSAAKCVRIERRAARSTIEMTGLHNYPDVFMRQAAIDNTESVVAPIPGELRNPINTVDRMSP